MAKITVIIPSHNYGRFLRSAIESALTQTFRPDAVIVIDDGSTDNSLDIANSYKDKGVFVYARNHAGLIATKNFGISLLTTDWVIFLDADDILPYDYLERFYDYAAKHNLDVVYSDMRLFGSIERTFKSRDFNFDLLLKFNFINNSALIRSDFLRQSGGYKEEMSGGYEDWELYVTLAELGARFGYIRGIRLMYRQHSEGLSRNRFSDQKSIMLSKTIRKLHPKSYSRILFRIIDWPLTFIFLLINKFRGT